MTRSVLVTGAAGLLGGEICSLLTKAGWSVFALINRNPDVRSNDGSLVHVHRTIRGDITKARLGLGDDHWHTLTQTVDRVVHCAAITEFTDETPQHRAVNVVGTQNVLEFCNCASAGLVHVSTAYVSGDREGSVLESELDAGQGFTNGYESTKFEAEKLVAASDVPSVIARPSIVLGHSENGRTQSFETIYPMLKVLAEGWVKTMPAKPCATFSFVPVDHVCDGVTAMAERFEEVVGRVFHLVSSQPTPLRAFPDTLAKFPSLYAPTWIDPADFDLATLPPTERRFFKRGAEIYAAYFTRSPHFDDTQYTQWSGQRSPDATEEWLTNIVAYAVDAGYIRPRKQVAV
ncbi:MAG: SDR family oxidoreductase [Pseudomonadota bacterium]